MNQKLIIIFLIFPAVASTENLAEYLSKNNTIVTEFLESLIIDQVGEPISGIALTDSSRILENYIYIGKNSTPQNGLHIYLFKSPDGKLEAYLWLDHGQPFPLPKCDSVIVGKGSYVLSGDVYTWKSLQSGHGVVHHLCPNLEWVKH